MLAKITRMAGSIVVLLSLCGCSIVIGSATQQLAADLSTAVLNQSDPETVREGLPAYLLLIDGLIEGQPESEPLLLTGAKLYGAYATAFVESQERARLLSDRAHEYGRRALCHRDAALCAAIDQPFETFELRLTKTDEDDVPALYGFAAAWATRLQVSSGDWGAIAELPRIRAMMLRVVELDEGHDHGGAHAYLGVLSSQLPPALGGKPEEARRHFERALELSLGRDLMVKVLYARWYARLVFDRPLHDRLLTEVIEAKPDAPGLTLSNTMARSQAQALLADADDYF